MKNRIFLLLSTVLFTVNSLTMFMALVINAYSMAALSALFIVTNYFCIRFYSNEVIADAVKSKKGV